MPSEPIAIEGRQQPPDAAPVRVGSVTIDPAHLQTLGILLLRGRNFTAEDTATALPVVLVSETMARRVIGVVEDITYQTLSERPRPVIYLPLAQRYAVPAEPPGDESGSARRAAGGVIKEEQPKAHHKPLARERPSQR